MNNNNNNINYYNKTFNPGYRLLLNGNIDIIFDDTNAFYQFKTLYNDGQNNVDIAWNVFYYANIDNFVLISNSTNFTNETDVKQYWSVKFDSDSLQVSIDSYFILYPNNDATINSYQICNQYNNNIFFPNSSYLFDLNLTFIDTENDYNMSSGDSILLNANSPPANGTCVISPNTGIIFQTSYNIECTNWIDIDGINDESYFNYFYDYSIKLGNNYKSSYNYFDINYIGLGNHTITSVIIDDMSLATCVDLTVVVSVENDTIGNSSTSIFDEKIDDFTEWLDDTFNNLSSKSNWTDILLLSQISYRLMVDYINYNYNNSDVYATQKFVTEQKTIINTIIESFESKINVWSSYSYSIISVLSSVTSITNVINVNNINTFSSSRYYSASFVCNVVTFLNETIVYMLDSTSSIDSNTVDYIGNIWNNILFMRLLLNDSETENESSINGQTMIDNFNYLSIDLLTNNIPSEFYYQEYDSYCLKMARISIDDTNECKLSSNNIILSDVLLNRETNNGDDFINCVLFTTNVNIYNVSQSTSFINVNDSSRFASNFINLDLINPSSDSYSDTGHDNDEDFYFYQLLNSDDYDYSSLVNSCHPIILSFVIDGNETVDIDIDYSQDVDCENGTAMTIPKCVFYNETLKSYDTNGCYAISLSNNTLECACLHLTFFSAKWSTFEPSIDYKIIYFLQTLKFPDSFITYPTGWIAVSLIILSTLLSLLVLNQIKMKIDPQQDKKDVPLLAHDIDVKSLSNVKHEYRNEKIDLIQGNDNLSFIQKVFKIWFIIIKNDNLWFGLCFRDLGTNLNNKQRIVLLSVKISITTAMAAIFYATSNGSTVGDWINTGYQSLFSFIIFYLLKILFKKRQPSAKQQLPFDDDHDDDEDIIKCNDESMATAAATAPNMTKRSNDDKNENGKVSNNKVSSLSVVSEIDVSDDKALMVSIDHDNKKRLKKTKKVSYKMTAFTQNVVNRGRLALLTKQYKCPNWCKYVGYIGIVIVNIVSYFVITIYCVFFNFYHSKSINHYQTSIKSNCSVISYNNSDYYDYYQDFNVSNVDVDLESWINYNYTQSCINKELNSFDGSIYKPSSNDSFGNNLTVGNRFLLSVVYSILLSSFVYMPLTGLAEAIWCVVKKKRSFKLSCDCKQ